jgi:ATP-dependent helicase HepA
MNSFIAGQRWISESEPELGLGTIVRSGDGRVEVGFKSAGETRIYAVDQAPLKRIRFRVGDKIRSNTDQEFVVKQVVEEQGLFIYVGENQRLAEAQLSDRVSLQGPQERLLAGRFDQSPPLSCADGRSTCSIAHANRPCADLSAGASI